MPSTPTPTEEPTGTPGVGTPVVIVNPTPCPDTCIDPPFPTTVAMSAPQSLNSAVCQIRPTATPIPTVSAALTLVPSPTFTPEQPSGNWYVACNLSTGYANARSFPSRYGQVVRTYPNGTILFGYESRMDVEGREWIRVTGYEADFNEITLWIARANDGITILETGSQPVNCSPSTPIPSVDITPYPLNTPEFPLSYPGVDSASGKVNPLLSGNPSSTDIVAFVLSCEAGDIGLASTQIDALNVAYIIRNRMKSGSFGGTAVEVVSQTSQWQCYIHGAPADSASSNLNTIDPVIRDYANRLVNSLPLPDDPTTMGIRWYGLFTFGYGPYPITAHELAEETYLADIDLYCSPTIAVLTNIFIGKTPFNGRPFTTWFFFG